MGGKKCSFINGLDVFEYTIIGIRVDLISIMISVTRLDLNQGFYIKTQSLLELL